MKLNFSLLMHHLSDLQPQFNDNNIQEMIYRDVRFYKVDTISDPELIYICDQNHLPDLKSNTSLPTICCIRDTTDIIQKLEESDSCYAIFQNISSLELFERIQDVFLHYERLDQALTDNIINNKPLPLLMNNIADFFSNPVYMVDSSLSLLCYCDNYEFANDDQNWKKIRNTGCTDMEMLGVVKKNNLASLLNKTKHAVLVDLGFLRSIDINFFDDSKIASILITEVDNKLTEDMLGLADYLGNKLNSVVQDYCCATTINSTYVRSFIGELLQGNQKDSHSIELFLSSIGWNPNNTFLLLRITFPLENFSTGTANHSIKWYTDYFPRAISFIEHNTIIFILSETQFTSHYETEFTDLSNALKSDNALCGISLPFRDFSSIREQYILAGNAIDLGLSIDPDACIHSYKKHMNKDILEKLSSVLPIKSLCHHAVLLLNEYDQENDGELVKSLKIYLQQERSLDASSKLLHIHRNTMVYRIKRISTLAPLDWNNESVRFHALLSCLIIEHLNHPF